MMCRNLITLYALSLAAGALVCLAVANRILMAMKWRRSFYFAGYLT